MPAPRTTSEIHRAQGWHSLIRPQVVGFDSTGDKHRAERHARSVAALDALVKAAQMLGRGAEARAAAEKHLRGDR